MKIAVVVASGVSTLLVGCDSDSTSSQMSRSTSTSSVNYNPTVIGGGSVKVGGNSTDGLRTGDGFVSVNGQQVKANPGDSVNLGNPNGNTHLDHVVNNADGATVNIE